MPLFYLHLRDGCDELLDAEGQDFPDMDGLRRAVMVTVRDIMSADVRDGVIDFRFRLDAENENGSVVYSLPFQHAVSIIPGVA